MLWRVFRDVSSGFYVDVGAFHPEIDSVTKWFYDQGWSGLNIEPVPESFAQLEAARTRDRNICAAAGAQAGVAQMTVFPASRGLSSLYPSKIDMEHNLVDVDVLPLRQLLEPHATQAIHFLKIDAEGAERDVLMGMDFTRFRPWIVLAEATEPLSPTHTSEQWQKIIVENGYEHVYFDGLNEFFVASERTELARWLEVPPNVFDDFELAATVREREWRHEMENVLRGEISARDADLAALRNELTAAQNHALALHNELTASQIQISSSQAAIAKLSSDVAELAKALRTSRETIEQVFKSRSWRWLAPIRDVNSMLRSYRENLRKARLFRAG